MTTECDNCKKYFPPEKIFECEFCNKIDDSDEDSDEEEIKEPTQMLCEWRDGSILVSFSGHLDEEEIKEPTQMLCEWCSRECFICESRGCKECVNTVCGDCSVPMCEECRDGDALCRGCHDCRFGDNDCKDCNPNYESEASLWEATSKAEASLWGAMSEAEDEVTILKNKIIELELEIKKLKDENARLLNIRNEPKKEIIEYFGL